MTSLKRQIIEWLSVEGKELAALYRQADRLRKKTVGDQVYLRGVIEFSNHCWRNCNYCGIRGNNREVKRYRMTEKEILSVCRRLPGQKIGTVVLQSGEDRFFTKEMIGQLIKTIKAETPLAVTVSVGEQDAETYQYWKECGMDRYLLRFETSNPKLFRFCHPDDDFKERLSCIKTLKKLGVQTGSGFLIGLPNESLEQLAADIEFCVKLQLEMIGVGPFIPHAATPFGQAVNPFDPEIYFKVVAILRLLNPSVHLPATTAYDAIQKGGRELALQRGANIFMPNCTPQKYRSSYQLYPGKPCLSEGGEACGRCAIGRIERIGRKIGSGRGDALPNFQL